MTPLQSAVANLDKPHTTSMSLWLAYWRARIALREAALRQYSGVTAHYLDAGEDAWMPSEGFKEIANDETETMRVVQG